MARFARLLACATRAAFVAVMVALANSPANALNCNCDLTCNGPGGATWTKSLQYSGYVSATNCNSKCESETSNQIASWASNWGVCGKMWCQGTSNVGRLPGTSKNVGAYETTRECLPPPPTEPHGSCCPPGTWEDVYKIFKMVQAGNLGTNYTLKYDSTLHPTVDTFFQGYVNYAGLSPNINSVGVTYKLEDVTGAPINLGSFTVYYNDNGSLSNSSTASFFGNVLQVGKKYRITRIVTFYSGYNATGTATAFADPNCKNRAATWQVILGSGLAAPGGGSGGGVGFVVISADGKERLRTNLRTGRPGVPAVAGDPPGTPSDVGTPAEPAAPSERPQR